MPPCNDLHHGAVNDGIFALNGSGTIGQDNDRFPATNPKLHGDVGGQDCLGRMAHADLVVGAVDDPIILIVS